MASSTSRGGAEAVPPVLPSIPLAPEPVKPLSEQSIGNLVKEATAHVSTLVRAEVELARAEVTAEVKKGLQGSIFFIVALVIVLFSLFFLFFTIAEVIAIWLPEWAAFAITFGIMLLAAGAVRPPRLPAGAQDPQAGAHDLVAEGVGAGAHPPGPPGWRPPS